MIAHDYPGRFIVLCGIDASGKTTQAGALASYLRERGFDVLLTYEPTDGPIGSLITSEIIKKGLKVPAHTEALLFTADRVLHLEKTIIPALKEGKIVICDRYLYSTMAYQGAKDVDLEWIHGINDVAVNPDVAIYLDIAPEVMKERKKEKLDYFEGFDYQKKVRKVFLELADAGELIFVEGSGSIEEVSSRIREIVNPVLERA